MSTTRTSLRCSVASNLTAHTAAHPKPRHINRDEPSWTSRAKVWRDFASPTPNFASIQELTSGSNARSRRCLDVVLLEELPETPQRSQKPCSGRTEGLKIQVREFEPHTHPCKRPQRQKPGRIACHSTISKSLLMLGRRGCHIKLERHFTCPETPQALMFPHLHTSHVPVTPLRLRHVGAIGNAA